MLKMSKRIEIKNRDLREILSKSRKINQFNFFIDHKNLNKSIKFFLLYMFFLIEEFNTHVKFFLYCFRFL